MVARGKPGKFAVGDTPTLADIFIVPQLANARRVRGADNRLDLAGMLQQPGESHHHPRHAARRRDAFEHRQEQLRPIGLLGVEQLFGAGPD